jgi:hypothetical protein
MHLPCVQSMISFLGRALSYAGDRHAERTQGEFREIRPLKSHYLYSTLCANKRARIRGQALTRNDSGATIVLPETRNQSRSGRWRHLGIVWMEWKKSKFQNHVRLLKK